MSIAPAPSAPTRASDRLLQGLHALAVQHDLRMHMHVDEVRDDTLAAQSTHGMTSVARLAKLGLLDQRLSIAHAVWVTDDDLDVLAGAGTAVVHNPLSNLRLGSGRAPVERMLARGIPVAVGSDGAASNDTQNVLEAAKLAALLPRVATPDTTLWPAAGDGLTMATRTPAEAFRMGHGRIGVGAPADFAAFDRTALPLVPEHDLVTQIVFAGAVLRARHVGVGGRLVVYDGAITTFDEQAAIAAAHAWAMRHSRTPTGHSRGS